MNDIENLLEEKIKDQINGLDLIEPGTEEHTIAIDNVAKLYRLRIDELHSDYDYSDKYERRLLDEKTKQEQLDEQKKDRYFRTAMEAAAVILPLVFYTTWMKRGFKFEESGTYTSQTFKNLFGRFKPTK